MKIAICHAYFYPKPGGPEILTYQLASSLGKAGEEVTVLTGNLKRWGETDLKINFKGFKVLRFNYLETDAASLLTKMTFGLALFFHFLLKKYDVIHAHDAPSAFFANLARKFTGVPVVFTPHYFVSKNHWFFLYPFIFSNALKADAVISISDWMEKKLKDEYGIKPTQIFNGVDTARFSRNDSKLRKELNLDDKFVFLFVGRFYPQKGLDYLMRAFASVKTKKAHLILAGDGPDFEKIKSLSSELKVGDKTSFIGPIDNEKIVDVYNACDCFVLSSTWEGLAIVLLEAMSCSKPAVVTAVGGNIQLVKNGLNGFLAKPKDPKDLAKCLDRMAGNPKIGRFGTASRKMILEKYSFEIMISKYKRVYLRLNEK